MQTNHHDSNRRLVGRLTATIVGADLLGSEGGAFIVGMAANPGTETAIINSADSAVRIDSAAPNVLVPDLEAIPTLMILTAMTCYARGRLAASVGRHSNELLSLAYVSYSKYSKGL